MSYYGVWHFLPARIEQDRGDVARLRRQWQERQGPRKTLTFVAGLHCDGITAPRILDGPINAETFLACVVQFLVPTLRPGDIAVMGLLRT